MSYKGKFKPQHPEKYAGNVANIIYRSQWELRFMAYLDNDPRVVEWASEEFAIPYVNPAKPKRVSRYFPDFRVKTVEGKTMVIEIKPLKETMMPKMPTDFEAFRVKKRYLKETIIYATNDAKWKAAKDYCEEKGWKFMVLTEKELFGSKHNGG